MIPGQDIIAAPATPPGRGAVAMVRISGPDLVSLAKSLTHRQLQPRQAHFVAFIDESGKPIDQGLALYFPAPASFTGEDVLELHCHGSPVVVEMLLKRVFQLGARPAQPGEFSRRAFLNGKLDLAQAEAIAALIESTSQQAVRAAGRSLEGEFSRRIKALVEELTLLRVQVEAAIDFSDEDIDFIAEGDVIPRLVNLLEQLQAIQLSARQGHLLQEGMTVVIAGKPNAGKSSLLNRLAQRDAAIVTHLPGTTRDLLHETIQLDGMPLHVIDTAGIRQGGDVIEQEGMRRAQEAMQKADRILLVEDATVSGQGEAGVPLPPGIPITRIKNKIDLIRQAPGMEEREGETIIRLSAKTGAGVSNLREHLKASMGFEAEAEDTLAARRRHLEALQGARDWIDQAREELTSAQAPELVAENLRLAQLALGEITGEVTTEDLLGRIFSEFCIGK